MPKNLRDRCSRCGETCIVPLSSVTVVYDRDEPARDRYEWQHVGCALVVKEYAPDLHSTFAPYLEARIVRARFVDPEFRDPLRFSDAPAITASDVEAFVRALASAPGSAAR